MIEQAAPRSYLNDDAFMAAWAQMGPNIRSEMVRAEREIMRGIAIQKDRMMGRGKYDMKGFYGLELAEEEAYRIEQTPRKSDDLEEVRKRVSELHSALAEDEEQVDRMILRDAELDQFHQMAAATGKTLPGVIREFVTMEQAFRKAGAALASGDGDAFTDAFMDALCQLADRAGFDPIQVLLNVLQAPREAH
ncbi:hypothetical protein [Bradyrhizobium yuanmingense]|uniref:hypothetical protein n=1 Tax=Bradyrhizobium yuanmingense TaxID=108015 RepID=UPI0023B992F6|nr:hypothetical protein [Bradyrhizobium yuanmingense]MDF0495376.1 hypothetical protein [Bradyrhizobium yuanmingense]